MLISIGLEILHLSGCACVDDFELSWTWGLPPDLGCGELCDILVDVSFNRGFPLHSNIIKHQICPVNKTAPPWWSGHKPTFAQAKFCPRRSTRRRSQKLLVCIFKLLV